MKLRDRQYATPAILYRDSKANIEALTGMQSGAIAFATDTGEIGVYDGAQWAWGNVGGTAGDMLKSVYDTDDDGVVDAAETVPWSGVTGKPATFPPDAHNHDERYYTETELNTSGAGGAVHWNNVTNKPSSFTPSPHTHSGSDITSSVASANSVPWSGVTGKPATFPPDAHNHNDFYYTKYELNTSGAGGVVHWNNVTSKPSTYPPSTHQHAAGDVTSGTFDAARIPNLDASKITSGTLSTDRFSAYADLAAEGRLGMALNRLVRGQEVRSISALTGTYWEDFTSVPSSDWAWAGSPFVTPPVVGIIATTILHVGGLTSGEHSFYYRSAPSSGVSGFFFLPFMNNPWTGQYAGLRLDDGTDNNYIEVVTEWQNAAPSFLYKILYRTGGGSVTTVTPTNVSSSMFLPDAIQASLVGTLWSSWRIEMIFHDHYSFIRAGASTPFVSWTPTRVGFVTKGGTQTWQRTGIDFIAW